MKIEHWELVQGPLFVSANTPWGEVPETWLWRAQNKFFIGTKQSVLSDPFCATLCGEVQNLVDSPETPIRLHSRSIYWLHLSWNLLAILSPSRSYKIQNERIFTFGTANIKLWSFSFETGDIFHIFVYS